MKVVTRAKRKKVSEAKDLLMPMANEKPGQAPPLGERELAE